MSFSSTNQHFQTLVLFPRPFSSLRTTRASYFRGYFEGSTRKQQAYSWRHFHPIQTQVQSRAPGRIEHRPTVGHALVTRRARSPFLLFASVLLFWLFAEESSKWIMGSRGAEAAVFLESQSVCRDAAARWWCSWGRTMVLNDANRAWWRRSCCVERSRGQEVLARRTPHPAVSVLNAKSYIVNSLVPQSVRFVSITPNCAWGGDSCFFCCCCCF